MLRIRKDFDYLKNAEPQLQTELKSLSVTSTETMTIANSRKVISARVKIKKKQQRATKRHSVRKIARTHKANKRKSSIRKIHISIEKNIKITNSCQHCNNIEHVKRRENFNDQKANENVSEDSIIKEFKIEKRKLKKLIFIFSVRMLKEVLLM